MTDHKEQALNLLESIHLETADVYSQGSVERDLRIRLAAVHATLELAEQQRIANLIEVAKWNDSALRNGGGRRAGDLEIDFAAERAKVDAVFDLVRKGLGLS